MQMSEDKWQKFIIDRLAYMERENIKTQILLSTLINSLPKEQCKNIIKDYKMTMIGIDMYDLNLPKGLKNVL